MKRIILVLLVAAGSAASADEIRFRNGTTVKCRIINVTSEKVEYSEEGRFITVDSIRVAGIVYGDGTADKKKASTDSSGSGDRPIGSAAGVGAVQGGSHDDSVDEIRFRDGTAVKCRIVKVDPADIFYSADLSRFSVPRNRVERIIYRDGSGVVFERSGIGVPASDALAGAPPFTYVNPYVNKAQRDVQSCGCTMPESCGCALPEFTRKDSVPVEPLLCPFPLEFEARMTRGLTDVNIYDGGRNRIASGSAKLTQYRGGVSLAEMASKWLYITPEFGYFYRSLGVRDFAHSVQQSMPDGFLPGVITDPATGTEISRNSVETLRYRAQFHSVYGDVRVGSKLVFGSQSLVWSLGPYLSGSVFELRKSIFTFEFNGQKERHSSSFGFAALSSATAGLELGAYFPSARYGLRFGAEVTRFFKYRIPDSVKFNESYYDDSHGLWRTREVSVRYSEITAYLFTFSAFCCL